MSLYRQAGGFSARTVIAAAVAAAVVGAAIGVFAGRSSVESRSAAEVIADARAGLRPAAAGLELVPIEYEGAVRGGQVVARTEYEAAQGAVARAMSALEDAADDMQAIDPAGYVAAVAMVERLAAAVGKLSARARVRALSRRAGSRVDVLAAGRG